MSDSETIRQLDENTKLVGNAVSTFARDFLTARLADWQNRTISAKPERAAILSQFETLIEPLATAQPEEDPVRELVQFFAVTRRLQQLTAGWVPYLPEWMSLNAKNIADVKELGLQIDHVKRSHDDCRQMVEVRFPFDSTLTGDLRRAVSRITISPILAADLLAFLEVAGEWLSEATRVLSWCLEARPDGNGSGAGDVVSVEQLAGWSGYSTVHILKILKAAGHCAFEGSGSNSGGSSLFSYSVIYEVLRDKLKRGKDKLKRRRAWLKPEQVASIHAQYPRGW